MTESFSTLRIKSNRLHDWFIHQAWISATGEGGEVTFLT